MENTQQLELDVQGINYLRFPLFVELIAEWRCWARWRRRRRRCLYFRSNAKAVNIQSPRFFWSLERAPINRHTFRRQSQEKFLDRHCHSTSARWFLCPFRADYFSSLAAECDMPKWNTKKSVAAAQLGPNRLTFELSERRKTKKKREMNHNADWCSLCNSTHKWFHFSSLSFTPSVEPRDFGGFWKLFFCLVAERQTRRIIQQLLGLAHF